MIRIGILGAARVAPRALVEPACQINDVTVHAIAARDQMRAEVLAYRYALPDVYGCYEELLESPEVDLVYIPLCNGLHSEWAVRTAQTGKHVLVEKPAGLNELQAAAIAEAARKSNVEVLEAVMTQHHPSQRFLRRIIVSNQYGKLRKLRTELSFVLPDTPGDFRFHRDQGGVFRDESAYWLQLSQLCFDDEPVGFWGNSDFSGPDKTDRTFAARMDYSDGRCSEFFCSWDRPFLAHHRLEFEGATIVCRNFLRPSFGRFVLTLEVFPDGKEEPQKVRFEKACFYTNQLAFLAAVINGKTPNIPWQASCVRARWMDTIHKAAQQISGQHSGGQL